MPRVRLSDVAHAAGVSKSTASRALNDADVAMAPATRAAVRAAADRLGYRPHAGARALTRSDTGALGLSIPDLTNPVWARIVRAAVDRARERDFAVLLIEDRDPAETHGVVLDLIGTGRVDALVMASAVPGHPLVSALPQLHFPYVFLNRAVDGSRRNVVARDARASELALEHLAALGHAQVALVGGPEGLSTAHARAVGFTAAAARLGFGVAPIFPAPFSEAGGAAAARDILALEQRPTAICVPLLGQAIGVMAELDAAGIDVPAEMSVVCYDNLPLAAYLRPALTRIDMPLAELGALGVDAAIDQLLGGSPRDLELERDPVLIEGASTAQPPVLDQAGSR